MSTSVVGRRLMWLTLTAALVGGGILYWMSAVDGGEVRPRPLSEEVSAATGDDNRTTQRALELVRSREPGKMHRLVDAYVEWAGDPEAHAARRLALSAIVAEQSVPRRLATLLEAIERDPTPPEEDPLWPYLSELLANSWQGETLTHGLDLMFAEQRPRARRALVSSFVRIAESERREELTRAQSQTLTNYFIDMHEDLPPSQKPEVTDALRRIAGDDVADIMSGKALAGGRKLEGERQYERALEEAERTVARAREEAR